MDENLKAILKNIWQDKPLLIAVLAGLAVVVYIIYKNGAGGAAASAPSASATPALAGAGVTYVEGASGGSAAPTPAPQPIVSIPVAAPGGSVVSPVIVPTVPTAPTTAPSGHAPGTTFLGPTGVKHYVATGTQTLSQIAAKFGLKSWNSIYAIPDNMKLFGKLPAAKAKVYTPPARQTITLPGSTIIGF